MGNGKTIYYFYFLVLTSLLFLHVEKQKKKYMQTLFSSTSERYNKALFSHKKSLLLRVFFFFLAMWEKTEKHIVPFFLYPLVWVIGHFSVAKLNYSDSLSHGSNSYTWVKHQMYSDVEILLTNPSLC